MTDDMTIDFDPQIPPQAISMDKANQEKYRAALDAVLMWNLFNTSSMEDPIGWAKSVRQKLHLLDNTKLEPVMRVVYENYLDMHKRVVLLRRKKPFIGNLKYIAFWLLSTIFLPLSFVSTISARIILKLSTRFALQDVNEIIETLEQKGGSEKNDI